MYFKSWVATLVVVDIPTDDGIKQLCFLIDTGASINIIYDFVCRFFKDEFVELEGSGSVVGFEGKEHKTQYMGISFLMEGNKYSGVFSVVEEYSGMRTIQDNYGIQVQGVLGLPFLVMNNWIIDFKSLRLRGGCVVV